MRHAKPTHAIILAIGLFTLGIAATGCGNAGGLAPGDGSLSASVVRAGNEDYLLVASQTSEPRKWELSVKPRRLSPNNSLRFEWNFNDGQVYTGTNQSYTFSTAGDYVISVTAFDSKDAVVFVLTLQITIPEVNQAPVASTAGDQIAFENSMIFLDGSATSDVNGDQLAYQWTQISGPQVLINDATTAIANFVAPLVDADTRLVFTLDVSDAEFTTQSAVVVDVLDLIVPADLQCAADADCDDGLFCNGTESCVSGSCAAGTNPCADTGVCDEATGACSSGAPLPDFVVGGLPLALLATQGLPESGSVSLTLNRIPENTTAIELTLSVWDADFPDEGRLSVNGQGTIMLFGSQASSAGDSMSQALPPLMTDIRLYQLGTNTLDFIHDTTAGYRIDDIAVRFVNTSIGPNCLANSDCDDGLFCNGAETCLSGNCATGANPCQSGETCDDALDQCVSNAPSCASDADCDDGLFCNGIETCVSGSCLGGSSPCAVGENCDETGDACSLPSFEGFGAVSLGGSGGEVYRVTSLGDAGAGTLRDGITNRTFSGGVLVPRTIVFDVGGTITFATDVSLRDSYLTIDGSTAPAPGITIRKASKTDGELYISSGAAGVHDLIITHLRFIGNWNHASDGENNAATLVLDGEDHPDGVYNIVLDHIVSRTGTDSAPDLWGNVHDVTISWSMFFDSQHPMTISHSGGVMVRKNISLHHNVFAKNQERNPQIRGNVQDFDYVNNVVYEWGVLGGGYGIRIRERNGVKPTRLNFINNYFLSSNRPDSALVYGNNTGASDDAANVGEVWVSGNVMPSQNVDGASTAAGPIAIPASAQVTTYAADQLSTAMLPSVGVANRDATEQALINEILSAMGGGGGGCTTASDCDDGAFCNGSEACVGGACVAGSGPCATGETCDETSDQCVSASACVIDADCVDGFYCNGIESCVSGSCVAGGVPCAAGEVCMEATDTCVTGSGWVPPIGIPMPSFGINETHTMYAGQSGYRDSGFGPYTHYVDNTGSCSDSNNGGTGSPSAPLCSVPGNLSPGDVVEIHGGVNGPNWDTWNAVGTQAQPIFIRGADVTNRPVIFNRAVEFVGQYLVVENLDFDTSEVGIGPGSRYVSFRHSDVHHRDTGTAVVNDGAKDTVFYNNEIHHAGLGSSRGDRNGFYAGAGSERVWFVDNHLHHNKGDSIAFCHNCGTPYPRWIYIGRNLIHEDEENAINIKYGDDVIITENTMYGYIPSIDSNGDAIRIDDEGIQSNIWIIFNDISDSVWGIASYNGISFPPHIVGNRIYNCQVGINGDANSLVNNLIYNVDRGINNVRQVMNGSNNIIANVADYHVHLPTFAVMDNTLFYQAGGLLDIRWGGNSGFASYSSVSGFQSATGECVGCVEGDPMFTMAGGEPTGLQSSSPAIDAGTDHAVYQTFFNLYGINIKVDAAGTPRPRGAAIDIGSFEKP